MRSVTIVAVGDLQLGDSPICVGFGFRSVHGSEARLSKALDGVRPKFADADVVFGNLECTISEHGLAPARWRSAQMRGHPSFAAALGRIGFTVLNVANNHASQHGEAAFRETVQLLRAQGIACCGLRGTHPWRADPVEAVTRHGIRVGVLGYNQRPRQYGTDTSPYAAGTEDEICADVHRLRARVDYVIASLHWGEEFVTRPSREEVQFAHRIIEAGASLVLGHHPHVLRPVEQLAAGAVAYSLGNFVGDMVWQEALRRGAILRCELAPDGARVTEVAGTFIDDRFQPTVLRGALQRLVSSKVAGLPPEAYRREVIRTVRLQRFASYRYAAANALRYAPRIFAQFVGSAIRNKVVGVFE